VVRYSRQVTYNRIIKAVVGVVDGGIGVNWEYLGFEKEEFKSFTIPVPDLTKQSRLVSSLSAARAARRAFCLNNGKTL